MGTFARDVAGLKSAFHPNRAGIGKWGIVESVGGVSIVLEFSEANDEFDELESIRAKLNNKTICCRWYAQFWWKTGQIR
ncbi:MAG: hypothetical protein J4G19_02875 [Pseudomonadales bacterium]|nr:hypothetical protein [Pseudomonadales bacterium]